MFKGRIKRHTKAPNGHHHRRRSRQQNHLATQSHRRRTEMDAHRFPDLHQGAHCLVLAWFCQFLNDLLCAAFVATIHQQLWHQPRQQRFGLVAHHRFFGRVYRVVERVFAGIGAQKTDVCVHVHRVYFEHCHRLNP